MITNKQPKRSAERRVVARRIQTWCYGQYKNLIMCPHIKNQTHNLYQFDNDDDLMTVPKQTTIVLLGYGMKDRFLIVFCWPNSTTAREKEREIIYCISLYVWLLDVWILKQCFFLFPPHSNTIYLF